MSDGQAILAAIESSRIPIVTVAIGEIKSMGFDIFIAGHERVITPNTLVMAHSLCMYSVEGKPHELESTMHYMKLMHAQHLKHLKKHSNLDEETIKDVFIGKTDFYLTAKDCIKYGLADKISSKFI